MLTPEEADVWQLEDRLPAEVVALRDRVRAYIDQALRPHLPSWWEAGHLPAFVISDLADLQAFGGEAGTLSRSAGLWQGVLMRELERGDSGLRSLVSVHAHLAMEAIARYGTADQIAEWLAPMRRGERLGCFALTDVQAGSDPAAMQTTCRWTGAEWRISGQKRWVTNGTRAAIGVVWAREEPDGPIRGFLLPTDHPGLRREPIGFKGSLRLSDSAVWHLDLRLDEAWRLPGAQGLGAALACLNQARYGIAWGVVGAAMDCVAEAKAYVAQRSAFGRALAATQLVQEAWVGCVARLGLMQLTAFRVAELRDAQALHPLQISLAKRDNVRMALWVARKARELMGAEGISWLHGPMRHLANLETVDTYEGTYAVHTLAVGRQLLGSDAF